MGVGTARTLERSLLLALALAAPALCLGQEASSSGADDSTPAASAPASSAPAAVAPAPTAPGAVLPGAALPGVTAFPVTDAGLTGLTSLPADFANYGASVGVGETDNVNLSGTHPESQTLTAANLFFDFIRSGSRLYVNAMGNFSDTDYLQGYYGNQVLGRFDGLGDLTLWEHHLKWLVKDDYGDSEVNVLQTPTPVNLQRINVFSTGPDLTLQPTLSTFVELQGLYSRNEWQDDPFSGNTETGTATVGRQFSPGSSISLVGQVHQEQFDNTTFNRNYQVRAYYARYALAAARTTVDLQAGVNQANDTGTWTSTPLVRVSISRRISPFSNLTLAGGREYSNAAGDFAGADTATTGGITVGSAAQTTGNALRTYGNLDWAFKRERTTLNLIGDWERNSYDVQSQFNFTQTNVGLSLVRQLTPKFSADITATVDRGQYGAQGFTNTYGTGSAGLVYRPGSWLVIYGRYDHEFQRSSGVTQDLGYDENRIFVMVGYYPHGSGTSLPQGMGGNGLY